MTDTAIDGDIKPATVASYLRRHPDFLTAYPDLANELVLPSANGPAASLAVHQLRGLREKNAELEGRLKELTAVAADNEKLMRRVHGLMLALLGAGGIEDTVRQVVRRLTDDFQSERVRLVFFGDLSGLPDEPWLLREPQGTSGLPEFSSFLAHGDPVAGRLAADKLHRLFGSEAPEVRSAALMRIGNDALLAIGSADPDRFHPGMGTLFLDMISTTVGSAIERARKVA
ncbi:DUF484 family protein [Luteibacter sp. UNCMF366Tsu5.1]|uniref:DUF484 family protein n=1 Tax=Luteibacter sp. UNCMF366Tsu5.1 TaxID=1502758 RepID=UPI0009085FE5|nr:DUF484 family protein [Luteibacter sp. UNCMF366Tsu5.1]SFW68995.1 hypothetical protein SAMN02800691_2980 [Luteibacter sp. UNCMF366Tsu5.1]